MASTPDKNTSVNYWALIGAILAISPAVGFFVAYSYQQQYFAYFAIPKELIIVDWASIVTGIASFLALSYFLILVLVFPVLIRYVGMKVGIVGNGLIWVGCAALFAMVLSLQYYESNPPIWVVFILPVLLSLSLFVVPVIRQRKVKGFRSKLLEDQKRGGDDKTPKWLVRYLIPASLVMGLVAVIFMTAVLEGRRQASIKTQYLVFSNNPSLVVLSVTQDRLICVKLNADNVSYSPVFTVLPLSEASGATLKEVRLGLLKHDPIQR